MSKVDTSTLTRFEPTLEQGLTAEQVSQRMDEGASNRVSKKVEKSVARMLFENTFTPFNIALFSIAIIILAFIIFLYASGRDDVANRDFGISKFGFLIPAVANSIIGSTQEINSKRILAKLRLLNQAKATVIRDGEKVTLLSDDIVLDDILFLSAGQQCLADCILRSGEVSVDEGMLTGESDPVVKRAGDTIFAGSSILIGSGLAQVEKVGDETYTSALSDKVRELPRHKSELMTSINAIIHKLVYLILIVMVVIVVTLCIKIAMYGGDKEIFGTVQDLSLADPATWGNIVLTLSAFAVGMIPEGLVLLASVALAVSIIKLAREKTLIQELYSLENLSRVDVICLDKTGTLTDGTMHVVDVKFIGDEGEATEHLRTLLGAFAETNPTSTALTERYGSSTGIAIKEKIPFSSAKKRSGVVYEDGTEIYLGAPEYLLKKNDSHLAFVEEKAKQGKRVIALTKNGKVMALFVLEDGIRASAKKTLAFFYENHVDVKIVSGDNLFTVSKIAADCGVINVEKGISLEGVPLSEIPALVEEYVIFARVSPEQKLAIVEALQHKNHKVAMTGDGVNDILALRKADASITFAKATDAAKSCSDVVLLDDDFVHLREVVGQGRRVVNNIERSAVLFLMKTTAIIGLAFCLIPFKRGQLWYNIENIYLLQGAVIGIGGFLLSLESKKEPIKGTFRSNVLGRALVSGVFILLAAILPLILNRVPPIFGWEPAITADNAKSMISILTTLAGLICAVFMCTPFSKYRLICIGLILVAGYIYAFGLPTSYIGGRATSLAMFVSPDGNILHSQVFREAFQPWNCKVTMDFHNDYRNYIVVGSFALIGTPLYGLAYWKVVHTKTKKEASASTN